MPVNWTNNFNDTEPVATVQFVVNGTKTSGTTLTVDSFVQTDSDGGANWAVGDEFLIVNDFTGTTANVGAAADLNDTLYTIEAIGFTGAAGNLTVSPAFVNTTAGKALDDAICLKEPKDATHKYRGTQRSAENHLRLRNMGII
jgi:hypothetical protein